MKQRMTVHTSGRILAFLENIFLVFVMQKDEIQVGSVLAELLFLHNHFH